MNNNEMISEKINRYYMSCSSFEEMSQLPSLIPFSESVLDFLGGLSDMIRKDREAKSNPVIQTFAFFIRKANLIQLRNRFYHGNLKESEVTKAATDKQTFQRIGKGLSFHIAPSNVPINFAYTLVSGLLAGNPCIVRASSKDFDETKIICRLISELEKKVSDDKAENETKNKAIDETGNKWNGNIFKYISVISYPHDKEITDYLSSLVNIRVIWGGDNTIAEIRKSPIRPRCTEVCFADRYSMLLVDSAFLCTQFEKSEKYGENIAKAFYNDTYLFDQNACGSPRLIYWYGKDADNERAKKLFWEAVNSYLRYEVQPVIAVDKLNMSYVTSVEVPGSRVIPAEDNNIVRVELSRLDAFPEGKTIADYRCAGGFFLEYDSENLDGLKSIVDERFQTLTYICEDDRRIDESGERSRASSDANDSDDFVNSSKSGELGRDVSGLTGQRIKDYIISQGLKGIDRVVPVGHSADFDLIWDGYDLIDYFTRVVY